MSLDLTVKKYLGSTTDQETGAAIESFKEVYNFSGQYRIMEALGHVYHTSFENCSTMTFDTEQLYDVYNELLEDRQNYLDGKAYRFKDDTDETFNRRVRRAVVELDSAIDDLECFFAQEGITEKTADGSQTYAIHASW